MLGFTGTYKGRRVSVQGTGMGQPSLAIYVHELLAEYGTKTLIRVGSCGSLVAGVKIRDLVVGISASTDSSMNQIRFEGLAYAPTADFGLVRTFVEQAEVSDADLHVGQLFSTDSFYLERTELRDRLTGFGVLAVEMEAAALYTLAAKFGARAMAVCTVSDNLLTGEETSSDERERTFADMAELALATVASDPGVQ